MTLTDATSPAVRQLRQLTLEVTAARVLLTTDPDLEPDDCREVAQALLLAADLIRDQLVRLEARQLAGQVVGPAAGR